MIRKTPLASVDGLDISVTRWPPKKKGKGRIRLTIRQKVPKTWRVDAALIYQRAADIQFVGL